LYPIKNLKRRAARTVLLVLGVALAITLTTIMFSISEGINTSTKELIDETGIDLFVYPKSSNPILQEFAKYLDLENGRELSQKMREGNPSITAASPWLVEGLYITTGEVEEPPGTKPEEEVLPKIYSITGKGYVPELQGDFGSIDLIKGSFLPTESDPFYADGSYDGGTASNNFTHEVILNKYLANLLKVSVGDEIYVNSMGLPLDFNNATYQSWIANATWFKVNGIIIERYEPPSVLSATMHLSELQYLSGKHRVAIPNTNIYLTDIVNEIYIDLDDPSDRSTVKTWLSEDFEDRDKITVLTSEELASEFNSFLDIFKGFSSMIIIITTSVVILFISTIMMISVQEQGREIGMLRAIGISRATVIKYIVIESIIICLIGFVVGVVFGYIGAGLLESIILGSEDQIPVGIKLTSVTPALVLQVSFITIFIGIIAAVIPAVWAARLVPVESIRKV
jgi:ABC-type lipoprotein release transport system permease subunit